MKKLEFIVKQGKLEKVKSALKEIGLAGTLTPISEPVKAEQLYQPWRPAEYKLEYAHKMKLELVLDDDKCDLTLDAVCEAGDIDEEDILIIPVDRPVRARSHEKHEEHRTDNNAFEKWLNSEESGNIGFD
jgi:nitrogen regulatory protein P-II 1